MLFAAAVAAANSTDHETSRTGGRAVHGIVPPAFEFRWAQYRVGLPREWRDGEVRHSHQTGRRDARRWPRSIEDDKSLTPSQGGEPERRRDERRTRRQAGASGNRAQGQCRRNGHGPRRSAVPRLHVTPSEPASRGVPSELGLVDTVTIVHSSQGPCCGARDSGSDSDSDSDSGSDSGRIHRSEKWATLRAGDLSTSGLKALRSR
jgi:hypothetical protein